MVQVAIMGYGTIGSGVAEILDQNADQIKKGCGQDVALKYVLDLRDFPGSPVEDKIVHDFQVIEQDPEVSVVVETMGGLNPAYPFVKASLLAGKHVVTSNKALVAAHGTELLAIAKEKNVNFFFEASVGGGIPIIRPLYRCLKGEKIVEITGILNGTTNYILSKMDKEGASFETVLKEAQALGYAERNPEADVEGYDTCRKIAILTAMATGKEVNYEDISTEGITKITDVDFKYADKLGTSVKLFGTSRMDGEEVHAWVAPVMIGKDHPLYAVNDVFNGIMVKGNMLGTSMFYGSGAGKLPTASAVIADIMEAVENADHHVVLGWSSERLAIADQKTSVHRYFVRVEGTGEELEKAAASTFGNAEVVKLDSLSDEFALLTGEMSEAAYADCAAALEKTAKIRQRIRAEF
ncbi:MULTISPECIES: homoserine dehydrogenase [unclassified Clostridium]|jgi:homoserine dehydrogenase|uniref:homoserine dehydrogenase n=1 Tax=unclassified Clostridium TaxID=2614128 RepID=UPI000E49F6D1|nr:MULTISPECIES: homoserine dehydrogenase [unclassified Clostridium]RHS82823.1 homoserine dehydrogenase [Clostridium sp. AM42-4]RHV89066.1 homoserine dehydrogenase [Clostridium sp. OF09-36]